MKTSIQLLNVQNSYILSYILQQKSVKANLNIALSYYMIEKYNKNCYAKRMEANYASLNESVGFSVEELDKLLDLAMI